MTYINIDNFNRIQSALAISKASLIAVTKNRPIEALNELISLGQKDFGENKVQELLEKQEKLSANIRWHLIGHLQTNKVKYIAPFVYMIHSVDSIKLVKEIQKRAGENKRKIKILLQIHIAEEQSKFGIPLREFEEFYEKFRKENTYNIEVCGLMGMATFTDDKLKIKNEFESLADLYARLKSKNIFGDSFCHLSIGMSDDYEIALESGGNTVRIGSAIFL